MLTREVKSVAVAALLAVAAIAMTALAAPVFADQLAAGDDAHQTQTLAADAASPSKVCGSAFAPATGGLLLAIGALGVWTSRPRRPRVDFAPAA
ncbi:hypothetical protein [Lacipirellula parvula]|uniref:Uncharacterized protein n=1 Tax=Lacipirellula parvula TaxID=2650471 RepID=A0A5K7XIQ1_9BACT|nr:hypothetical protein [Lacipirellula parvula]BBO35982.1 hypothetical protein PLANPX_5594 [Lacipirellula parvula]